MINFIIPIKTTDWYNALVICDCINCINDSVDEIPDWINFINGFLYIPLAFSFFIILIEWDFEKTYRTRNKDYHNNRHIKEFDRTLILR